MRDAPAGLEVGILVRHREIDFAAGALVFPGGQMEPSDAELAAALAAKETDDPPLALANNGMIPPGSFADWRAHHWPDQVAPLATPKEQSVPTPRSTVRETLRQAEGAGLSWPPAREHERRGAGGGAVPRRWSKRGHWRIEEPDGPACIAN